MHLTKFNKVWLVSKFQIVVFFEKSGMSVRTRCVRAGAMDLGPFLCLRGAAKRRLVPVQHHQFFFFFPLYYFLSYSCHHISVLFPTNRWTCDALLKYGPQSNLPRTGVTPIDERSTNQRMSCCRSSRGSRRAILVAQATAAARKRSWIIYYGLV